MTYDKEKARWARIKRVYGLTKEDYDELDTGYCPICLRRWSSDIVACVDHDHSSKFVRGVVCRFCNHYVIGNLRDHVVVSRIARYLKNQPKKFLVPKAPVKRRRKKRH